MTTCGGFCINVINHDLKSCQDYLSMEDDALSSNPVTRCFSHTRKFFFKKKGEKAKDMVRVLFLVTLHVSKINRNWTKQFNMVVVKNISYLVSKIKEGFVYSDCENFIGMVID